MKKLATEKQAKEKLLDCVVIAAPCPISWESMSGDDKVRHCGGCSKNVYNLSAMTENEAENFLQINGATQCMRFFRRQDGTIMTDNCPVGLRKIRDRVRRIGRWVASLAALLIAIPSGFAQGGKEQSALLGKPAMNTRGFGSFLRPAPAGFHYDSRAGGPILVRDTPKELEGEPVIEWKNIDRTKHPGTRPVIMGEPPLVVPTVNPSTKNPKTGPDNSDDKDGFYKLRAEKNRYADETALEFYKKAKTMERKSNFEMAEFYYEKALDAIDKQTTKAADPAFRKLIEGQIKGMQLKKNPGAKN